MEMRLLLVSVLVVQSVHCCLVKLSLSLIKQHVMKTYGQVEAYLHVFIISALCGDEWSVSRLGSFTSPSPAERVVSGGNISDIFGR
jgi:hypothetical protein